MIALGPRPVRIVTYDGGAKDNVPRSRLTTWALLTEALTARRVTASKERTPAWSAIEVMDGARRGLAGVVSVSALVLDYDGTCTLAEARATWAPWAHIGHSTWKGPPNCRVVVPLATPCPAELWPRVYAWARQRDARIDRSTSDASRIWFVPATASSEVPFEAWVHDGPALELGYAELPDPSRPPGPPPPRETGAGGERLARRRLDDPAVRLQAATYLRLAVNANGAAKGALCPGCGRHSVWFPINKAGAAVCNHRSTCGWVGPLGKVLDLADAA